MRLAAALLFVGILVAFAPESPQAFQWRNRPMKQGFLWRAAKDPVTNAVETSSKEPHHRASSIGSSKEPPHHASSKESSKEPPHLVSFKESSKLPLTGEPGTTGVPGTRMPSTLAKGTEKKGGTAGTEPVVSHAPMTTDLICSTGRENASTSKASASSPVPNKSKTESKFG